MNLSTALSTEIVDNKKTHTFASECSFLSRRKHIWVEPLTRAENLENSLRLNPFFKYYSIG